VATDELLIPEGSVLLHIGPQKTGSTGIQQAMHQARAELADQGVLYPGPMFRPAEGGWAVMGINAAVGRPAPRIELWDQLARDVAETSLPRVCVSDEDFARADDAAVERIVSSLGGDAVHLVYVARRIDRLLPSQWQERVKARLTLSYPEFLDQMVSETAKSWEWHRTWDPQTVGDVVDRWAKHVDRSKVTVIVSSDTDREVIPRAFERLLGLTEGLLVPPDQGSNRSLGFAEAEAVRHVNKVFAEQEWSPEAYWRVVQAGIVKKLKNSPRTDDPSAIPGMPASAFGRVADWADQQAAAIKAAGVRVVGDPDSLRIRDIVSPVEESGTVDAVSLDLFANVVEGAIAGGFDLQERTVRKRMALKRAARKRPVARDLSELTGRELAGLLRRRLTSRLRPRDRRTPPTGG
jgi:hypothetical protein